MAEKYTLWSDKSNGINPFLPEEINLSKATIPRLISVVAMAAICVPRFLVAFVMLALTVLWNMVCQEVTIIALSAIFSLLAYRYNISMIPGAVVSTATLLSLVLKLHFITFLRRMLGRLLLSIALFLLGVEYSVTKANTARVVGIRDSVGKEESPLASVNGGDVIICNLTNVLEILLLQSVWTPLFLFPVRVVQSPSASSSYPATYLCEECEFLRAIAACFAGPTGIPVSADEAAARKLRPLSLCVQSARRTGRPVVLFVEGVKTNGTGVLEFPAEIFAEMSPENLVHLAGMVYPTIRPPQTSPPAPVGSQWWRLFCLGGSLSPYPSQMVVLSASYVPKISVHKVTGMANIPAWVAEVRNIFAKLLNKKTVNLGADSYKSFQAYYNAVRRGQLVEAKSIADSRKVC